MKDRATWMVVAFLLLLPAVIFADVVWGGQGFWVNDLSVDFYPYRTLLRHMGEDGRLSFWNPWIFGGMPLLGDVQMAMLYPFNLPAYFMPTDMALSLYILMHLGLAGAFAYLLLRDCGYVAGAAFGGAAAWGLSGYFIAEIARPNVLGVGIWLPLIVLLLRKFLAAPRGWHLAALAGLFALQFLAGFPQATLYLLTAYVLWAAFAAWETKPPAARWMACAAPPFLGFLLAGAQMVPFAELIRLNPRFHGSDPSFCLNPPVTLLQAALLVLPEFHPSVPLNPDIPTDGLIYVGAVPALLTLLGLWRRDAAAAFLGGTGLCFLLLGLGDTGPLRGLLPHLPFFNKFRVPERLLLVTSFCVCWLVAHGLQVLERKRYLQTLLLALLILELGWMARTHAAVRPLGYYLQPTQEFFSAYGQGTQPRPRFLATPGTLLTFSNAGMYGRMGNVVGLDTSTPYSYMEFLFRNDHDRLPTSADLWSMNYFANCVPVLRQQSSCMKLLDLRYVVEPANGGVVVRTLAGTYPRAFLAERCRVADREEQYRLLSDSSFDARHEILLPPGTQCLSGGGGSVEFVEYLPDEIRLRVSAANDSYLFLSETWFPGWHAQVDGKEEAVVPADIIFRAVRVPAGTHTVHFFYRPASFYWGLGGTLLGVVLCCGLVFHDFFRTG